MLTREDIEAIRRVGRDEAARTTRIGLAELDALCDAALQAASQKRALPVAARVGSVVVTPSGGNVLVGTAHGDHGLLVQRADFDDLMTCLRNSIYE